MIETSPRAGDGDDLDASGDEPRGTSAGDDVEVVPDDPDAAGARRLAERWAGVDAETVAMLIGISLALLLTWWLLGGLWQPGVPTGDDTSAHLVRTQYAIDHFYWHQLDGWQTSFGMGYQEFLFIGPLFTIGAGLLHTLSFGLLSVLDAFKVMIALSYLLVPVSVAVLTCAFGLGRRAAGIAALLTVCVNSFAGGVGVDSVFRSGLVANQLGTTFVFLSLAGIVWVLRQPTRRRILFAGGSFGLLIVTHGIGAIITMVLGVAVLIGAGFEWWLLHRRAVKDVRGQLRALADLPAGAPADPALADDAPVAPSEAVLRAAFDRLGALLLAGVMAFGIGAFVLVPVLLHGDLRGFNTAYPDRALPDTLAAVAKGEFLYPPLVAAFVVVGMVLLVLRWRSGARLKLTLVVAPFLFLVLAHAIITLFPGTSLALQMTGRAYAYLAVVALLPLAGVLGASQLHLGRALRVLGMRNRRLREPLLDVAQVLPLLVALALVWVPGKLADVRNAVSTTKPTPAIVAASDVLRREVPEGGRFVMQRAAPKEMSLTGMSHPDFWLPWVTGRDTLNIYNVESSTVYDAAYEAEHLTDHPPDEEARRLARYGVTHVLLIDAPAAPGLMSSAAFEQVWTRDTMAVLKVRRDASIDRSGDPTSLVTDAAGVPVRAQVTRLDPEHLQLHLDADRPTVASVAIAWNPKWRVTVNGETTRAEATDDKLMRIVVPPGGADVTLAYGPDGVDALARLLTLTTIVILVALVVVPRVRGRGGAARTPEPDAPS